MFILPEEGIDIRALERSLIVQALQRAYGNQTRAAKLLGLTRDQVRYRIVSRKILPSEYLHRVQWSSEEESRMELLKQMGES